MPRGRRTSPLFKFGVNSSFNCTGREAEHVSFVPYSSVGGQSNFRPGGFFEIPTNVRVIVTTVRTGRVSCTTNRLFRSPPLPVFGNETYGFVRVGPTRTKRHDDIFRFDSTQLKTFFAYRSPFVLGEKAPRTFAADRVRPAWERGVFEFRT